MQTYEKKKFNLLKEIDELEEETILTGNSKYIILINYNQIIIYSIEQNNINKVYNKKYDFDINKINMNKIYENIFLITSDDACIIFEISKTNTNYTCEEKVKIITKDLINFAIFSDYNEKIIGTVSNKKIIRIWDIDSNFNNITIKPECVLVENLIFNHNKNLIIAQLFNKDTFYIIYIYNILYGINIEKIIKRNNREFIFEVSDSNFDQLLFVNKKKKYIELMDFKDKENKGNKISLDLKENDEIVKIKNVFFYKNFQLLFIFYKSNFVVFHIKSMKKLYEGENPSGNIITKYCLKDNNAIYIFFVYKSSIISFKYKCDKINISNIEIPKINSNKLFPKKYKNIYSKPNFDFYNSLIDKDKIKKKYYLDIEEIKNEFHKNYGLSLEKKKENVRNKIKEYNENDSINNKYLFLIELLIQDNTNADLLKIYLKFLKENEIILKDEYKNTETFDYEYNNYNVALTPEEIQKDFNLSKISEKDQFFNLLNKIIIINNQNDFNLLVDNYKEYNFGRFNQGIEYNNKELYWFRNKSLLIYTLLKIDYNILNLMIYCINKILEKKFFENPIILDNYKYLTLLIILIILPLPKDYCDDNLKLIESLCYNKNENLTLDAHKLLKNENKNRITNYREAFDSYNNLIQLNKIKNFLKKIFCSNIIKEAFQILYPSYIYFPFQSEKDAENYINKHINFVVFYSSRSNGVTDKFSLESYIFLEPKPITINTIIINNKLIIELVEKALFLSGIIKTNYHELNHNLYNMFYYHENGNAPLNTPRKEGEKKQEGGRYMELLLFGRALHKIKLKEALYILNEANYNKNIIQFKEDFENLASPKEKKDDIKIQGEFKDIILPDSVLKQDLNNLFFIQLDDSDFSFIDTVDDNDVLGREPNDTLFY